MEGKRPNYIDILRFVTPVGVTISLFILTLINAKVIDIDSKLFKHLTNDEMHTPRGYIVTKAEFELYKSFEADKYEQILKNIDELKCDVKELIRKR